MARIKPFQGLRYNKDKVKYDDVVTQPYDKISAELREQYYQRSEYTTAKLIVSKAADPYLDAQQNLHDWIEKQILVNDSEPCLYAYNQEYQSGGHKKVRRGLVTLVGLETFDKKIILPHERTLSKPKADRLNLLRATHTHFGQIFLLYQDIELKINSLLHPYISETPDQTLVDHFGDTHSLWKISDPKAIATIVDLMKDKQLLIADGHHRYETSCNFARENNQVVGEEGAYGYTMATLVNMHDEGLTVLPTHRMIHGLTNFNEADFITKAQKYFKVKTHSGLEQTIKTMDEHRKNLIFGFYAGKDFYTLELTDHSIMNTLVGSAHCTAWKQLDVAVLHTLLLENILGITKEKQEAQENVTYIRTAHSAYDQVHNKKEQAVFFLNNTTVQQVYDVAQAGEVMPQKSTDFYPKLLSGMVMYKIK